MNQNKYHLKKLNIINEIFFKNLTTKFTSGARL